MVQAFGSDWGVFPFEPLPAIYCAVPRMTRHFTRDGAYATFDENVRGTLTPGKLADFVVLSKDILSIPPAELLSTIAVLSMHPEDLFAAVTAASLA